MRYPFYAGNVYQRCQLLLVLLLLGACAAPPVVQSPPAPVEIIVEPTPIPAPAPAPPPVPEPVPVIAPAPVAIILSADIPELVAVATQLGRQLGENHYSIYSLQGQAERTPLVLAEVAASEAGQVVAIGLLAARAAQQLTGVSVVFCQTFNYQDAELVAANFKGVSLLPSFELQFAAWRDLAPELQSVGVVSGPGQETLIGQIEAAANQQSVQLVSRYAETDKAALQEFKLLNPEVQGILLLPDNRILSPTVVREIMSYSIKHRLQVAVYGHGFLQMGGLLSFTVPAEDLAAAVLARLAAQSDGNLLGADVTVAQVIQVEVNPAIVEQLGLTMPANFPRLRRIN